MHLAGTLADDVAQTRCYLHVLSASGLGIEDDSTGDMDGVKLFDTDSLCRKLHFVHLMALRLAMFVFDRNGQPSSFISRMGDAVCFVIGRQKFYRISYAVESELARGDADGTQCYVVSAFLSIERVVNMLVQQLAFNRELIVIPLLLKVYECPLPGAEPEVLYPRQHEHFVFAIHESVR